MKTKQTNRGTEKFFLKNSKIPLSVIVAVSKFVGNIYKRKSPKNFNFYCCVMSLIIFSIKLATTVAKFIPTKLSVNYPGNQLVLCFQQKLAL